MDFSEDRVRFVCDWLIKNKPNQDCDFYKMRISIEILRVLVDNEWTNQAIFPNNHPVTSPAVQEAIKFLRTNIIGFQFQERVCRLAVRLYNIQNIAGLNRVIDSLKAGDITLAYAEIEASDFFFRRGIQHEFVAPSGIKGNDYDIRLTTHGVNCEVKHKIEDTNPSKETLERTLSAAKAQVPAEEPAILFVKIPVEWVRSPEISGIVERAKGTFFPRSLNILGIIIHWEEPSMEKEGAFFWKFRYEINSNCRFVNPELTDLILNKEATLGDSITVLMNKFISKCSDYPPAL
jgi:hypothetical protein